MESKIYRKKEFFNPADHRSLIVDTSAGLSLGPLPGLESFKQAVKPILHLVDGVVTSPGQAQVLSGRTHQDTALLVRTDWTNALRGPDFVLPPERIEHISLMNASQALELGASALVLYFLLGHEEQIEAGCLKRTVQLAIEGRQIGLPLIIDVQPIGDRVVLLSKAVELGASYGLEGGADGIVVPWPGVESFKLIIKMSAELPIWVKPSTLDNVQNEIGEALQLGAAGLWLDEKVFAHPDAAGRIESLSSQIHPSLAVKEGPQESL
jgi:DhnA family fructose-bisphosphate aldolase class Ia